MTLAVQRVLHAMLEDPMAHHYGLALCKRTNILAGTLYPILHRLEVAGWIVGAWEDLDQSEASRPRRHYYQLTGFGAAAARDAIVATLTELSWKPST